MDIGVLYRAHRSYRTERKMRGIPTANLALWLDPARNCLNAAGGQCVHGDAVANWTNRSESAGTRTFTQGTAADRPLFQSTGSKFPYVKFDGVSDYLRVAHEIVTSTQGALFAVTRSRSDATETFLSTADEGVAANTSVWAILNTAAPRWDVRSDEVQATDDRYTFIDSKIAQTGAPIVWMLRDDGAAWSSKVGGVTRPLTNITGVNAGGQFIGKVTNRDSFTLGCLYHAGGASTFWDGDLYELIVLEGASISAHVTTVTNYLREKYRYRSVAHLGDSWAADTGYGIELRAQLRDKFIHVYDHGVGSETLSQIGARWDSDVEGKGFDCVIVEGAINDLKAASAGDNETLFTEFRRICLEAIADGCKVVGCTCGPFGNNSGWTSTRQVETDRYNEKVRAFCSRNGIPCMDLYEHAVNPDNAIRSAVINSSAAGQNSAFRPAWELAGGLHYNAGGDAFVASALASKVEQALTQIR